MNAIEKKIELDMLMVDGLLDDIMDEMGEKNVYYCVVSDGKPQAYLLPFNLYNS